MEEPYCQDYDGWNYEHLNNTGIFELLDNFRSLDYELKNCRRGSYAGFGDTAEDLIVHLVEMKGEIEEVIMNLERELDAK